MSRSHGVILFLVLVGPCCASQAGSVEHVFDGVLNALEPILEAYAPVADAEARRQLIRARGSEGGAEGGADNATEGSPGAPAAGRAGDVGDGTDDDRWSIAGSVVGGGATAVAGSSPTSSRANTPVNNFLLTFATFGGRLAESAGHVQEQRDRLSGGFVSLHCQQRCDMALTWLPLPRSLSSCALFLLMIVFVFIFSLAGQLNDLAQRHDELRRRFEEALARNASALADAVATY
jgi:hypothetical protein